MGLGTWSAYRFKNIRVTSPDGRTLWDGPPALDSSKPTDMARSAETQPLKVEAAEGWVSLFNGKNLAGWKPHAQHPGNWHVENGVLIGGPGPLKSLL